MNEVAKNLKKIRVSAKMTQEELAEKLFVTRQTISNWETGKSQPDVQTLTSLSEVLNVEVTELIYGRKSAYPRFQKKYIITASISLFVIIAVIVLELTLYPHLRKQLQIMLAGSLELMVYDFTVKPIGALALGVFILSVLSFWVDTRLEKRLRVFILIIGIILLLLSFWLLLEIVLINTAPQIFPGFLVFSPVFSSVYLRTMFITVMPLLSGMGLFLGFNRRNERS